MGRFKNIEFVEMLVDTLNEAIKSFELSEEALKKIAPKFSKLLSDYEESISTFYLNKHKFNLDSFLKTHFNNQKKIQCRRI